MLEKGKGSLFYFRWNPSAVLSDGGVTFFLATGKSSLFDSL
tara:strand:- start:1659 stop:1781 length:123 start_codon:yes stop_codon:yes gene_type:complete